MLRVGDARRGVVLERRRLGAAQRGDDAGEDDREAVAARVDDAGVAQHGEQVGAALDAVLTGVERALEHRRDHRVLLLLRHALEQPRGVHVRDLTRDAVGHLAHHGEDRALGGLAHRAVGPLGGARHRRADQHRVDQLARPGDQLLGGAADQLGEDHAGVAAGAQQRGARHGVDDLVAADLVDLALRGQAVELVEHRAQGQRHVVARVAVGDREHVEVVDLLAPGLELRKRALDDGAEADQARIGQGAGAAGDARP